MPSYVRLYGFTCCVGFHTYNERWECFTGTVLIVHASDIRSRYMSFNATYHAALRGPYLKTVMA